MRKWENCQTRKYEKKNETRWEYQKMRKEKSSKKKEIEKMKNLQNGNWEIRK